MSVKTLWFIALFLLSILGAGLWLLEGAAVHRVIIAAGPRSDGAYTIAQAIAEVAQEHHPSLEIEVVETL